MTGVKGKRLLVLRSFLLASISLALLQVIELPLIYQDPSFRKLASGFIFDKSPASVGIVVAACEDRLDWLLTDPEIRCSTHDLFVYDRCPSGKYLGSHQNSSAHLKSCVQYFDLSGWTSDFGKAHHAFLTHILTRYDRLNPVTAFLKGSNIHDREKLLNLDEHVAYTSLAPSYPVKGRRGKATMGLDDQKLRYGRKSLESLRLDSVPILSLGADYVSFRSAFAASSQQIGLVTRKDYTKLLDFVLSGHDMENCDNICSQSCPNCEVLERVWPSILHCGSCFTPFHEVHDKPELMWNAVHPNQCSSDGNPLLLLKAKNCGEENSICFQEALDDVVKLVYIAGIHRWNLTIESWNETINDAKKEAYDMKNLQTRLQTDLGIQILTNVSGYPIIKDRVCDTTSLNYIRGAAILLLNQSKYDTPMTPRGEALVRKAFQIISLQ